MPISIFIHSYLLTKSVTILFLCRWRHLSKRPSILTRRRWAETSMMTKSLKLDKWVTFVCWRWDIPWPFSSELLISRCEITRGPVSLSVRGLVSCLCVTPPPMTHLVARSGLLTFNSRSYLNLEKVLSTSYHIHMIDGLINHVFKPISWRSLSTELVNGELYSHQIVILDFNFRPVLRRRSETWRRWNADWRGANVWTKKRLWSRRKRESLSICSKKKELRW